MKMSKSLGNVIDPRTVIIGGKVRLLLGWVHSSFPADACSCVLLVTALSSPTSPHAPGIPPATPNPPLLTWQDAKKDPPYGADVLRLWVASVDYSSDVLIGGRIISQVGGVLPVGQ